ncbi:MAG: 3-ketoacyl-CoA thiolase [Caldithrix sp. RBG_13_44_9]|nr:MAG: 3-ketoacyl-CoA thiolase [Caldithrix sp. RBG_13_44_9]
MNKLNKSVYLTAGFNTVFLGTGRKEFHPKKSRPGIDHYIVEAGKGTIAQIQNQAHLIDEGVISNFMAARFNRQGNLAAFIPAIDPALLYKPCSRVEGACGSGGLGVYTAIKSVLSGISDVVLTIGVEVQNSVKAVYGADFLAGAGYYEGERKEGHAHFFPDKFSKRAAACFQKYGHDKIRSAMARWYEQAIKNARQNPKAQEYHNTTPDLYAVGMTPPNPRSFVDHLNVFDCSKVSDGAASIIVASEDGLKRLNISRKEAIEVVGIGIAVDDIKQSPPDLTQLTTTRKAAQKSYEMAVAKPEEIGVLEIHDCFTITALLALEAACIVKEGEAADFVEKGETALGGEIPTNATGGLIGFGHPTGGTGVRQAVDLWQQLTGKAGDCQVTLKSQKPYGMMINMGGNDKTVATFIFKSATA